MKTFTQYLEMAQEDYSFLDEFLQITNWTPEDGSRYADVLSEHDLLYHIDDSADDIIKFEDLDKETIQTLNNISDAIHNAGNDVLDAFFDTAIHIDNELRNHEEQIWSMGFEEGMKDGQSDKAQGKEYNDDRYLDHRGDEDDDLFEHAYRKGYSKGYAQGT